jgi:hypothetical protein
MLRIPHCLDNRLIDDGRFVSPMHRPSCIKDLEMFLNSKLHYYNNVNYTFTQPITLTRSNIWSCVRIPLEARISVFSMYVAVLLRDDPPSKESYRLRVGLSNRKSDQGQQNGCRDKNNYKLLKIVEWNRNFISAVALKSSQRYASFRDEISLCAWSAFSAAPGRERRTRARAGTIFLCSHRVTWPRVRHSHGPREDLV